MIKHKNIVEFRGFSFVEDTATGWLVYPWMSNGNSRAYVRETVPEMKRRFQLVRFPSLCTVDFVDLIGMQITDAAEGLMHLHSRKPPIRHGDIKAVSRLLRDEYSL